MDLLALDTSTPRAALALERRDGCRFFSSSDPARRHGRELLPAIHELLTGAGLRPADLGAIAVGLGPGSYTGLRVGVTAAKVLAYAIGAPVVGLDSLEWFARCAPISSMRVLAISDAQRGDFHVAEFRRDEAGAPLLRDGPTRIVAAGHLAASWAGPVAVTGPGLERWDRPWPEGVSPIVVEAPDPSPLLDLAREAIAAGRAVDIPSLEPIYLRRSAAEDQWKGRPPS